MARGDKASTPVLPVDAAETLARTLRARLLADYQREGDYAIAPLRAIAGRCVSDDDARTLARLADALERLKGRGDQ